MKEILTRKRSISEVECNTPEFPTPLRNQNRKGREEIWVLHKRKEKNLITV